MTMHPPLPLAQLTDDLKAIGVDLWVESGQLRFRAPKGVLTPERMALLRDNKSALIEQLTRDAEVKVEADPQAGHEPFPLTDVQTAYLLGRRDPFGHGGVACHGYLEVTYPELDPARLEKAWNLLIERHGMLRAVIAQDGYQRVLPDVPRYAIRSTDLRQAPAAEVEAVLVAVRSELDHQMHDIATWPLFELRQTRTPAGDVVHFSLDSLIADWASAQVLFTELDVILSGCANDLPPLDIGFRDYLLAERRLRETSRYRRDRQHWLERVDELPPCPDLPRLAMASTPGPVRFCRHEARLLPAQWDRLKQQSAARGMTASIAVMAAYAAVLQRWARHPRFSLNLTLLNRLPLHAQVNGLVGDFTSVSLLTVEAGTGLTFAEQAAQLGERLFTDLDHRLFSGIEVMREIARRRGREAALMPIVFTSAIGLGRQQAAAFSSGRRAGYGLTQTPQVFLDCQVMDDAEGLGIHWDVRQGIFPEGVVEDMFGALRTLLAGLADQDAAWNSTDPVSLPEWQARERAQVNDTAHPLSDALLHQGFLAQASRTPDALAVISPSSSVTYSELMSRASAVMQALRSGDCKSGDRVAIVMDKGVEQVIAVLGVLMAGAVYLPVDTAQPRLRREKVLANAGVGQILTQSWVGEATEWPPGSKAIDVDTLPPATGVPATFAGHPDTLAYVIYTSGSSGDPKGVMVQHRAALNTVEDVNRRFGIAASDRVLGLAQLGFDLSVYDIFGPLSVGAALVLPAPGRGADPSHLAELINRHRVTVWNSVPAQLQMLVDHLGTEAGDASSLRLALLSGDWIPVTLAEQARRPMPGLSLIGLGGATEASIWSNYHRIGLADPAWSSVPYGVPLANQGFRILDESLRDVPVWTTGDLCITGHGLAAGYLGDPVLTAARFFEHPADGQRLYKTGDLGRYRPGGEIEFLGREDGQVKIRGHRIELGEVEAALLAHPSVAAASTVAAGKGAADQALMGFVKVARGSPDADSAAQALMPDHLVPTVRRFADDQLGGATVEQVDAHVKALHRAALASMLNALVERGAFVSAPEQLSAQDVLRIARVHERHHWLVRRWLHLLACAGWLACSEDGEPRYSRQQPIDPGLVRAAWDQVERQADGLCTPEFIHYHRAHVDRLHELVDDVQNPFELLFPQGRQDVAHAVYRDNAIARYNNHVVAALMNRVAAAQPAGEILRVLEIGAGTGATSSVAVPMLEGHDVDYLYTDMTAFFMPEARRQFQNTPWVRFGLFNLDEDFRSQGLASNSVDIALCAGVLNSTRDVDAAMASAVELLAPGGWLVFTEPTADHPHILLTQGFMMAPAGGDRARGETPFRSVGQWHGLIRAHGGEPVLCLPQDGHPMAPQGMHVIAARFKTDCQRLSAEQLSRFLAQRLPAHMVPTHLQIVDRFPLTANSKIDRKALAAWRPATSGEYSAQDADAGDALETALCALWADALGIAQIGREGNFYDHGADSLILARVAGRLREEVPLAQGFAYDSLLRQMLNEPNVAALARTLRATGGVPGHGGEATGIAPPAAGQAALRRAGSNALVIPFGEAQAGPVRVLFHAALGTMDYFQHLGRALAAQQLGPVIGLAIADTAHYLSIDPKELINRLADDYAQRLIDEGHTRFQLIGYCLGGLLATEVARRLMARGLEVVDLTLVDSIPMFIETDEELAFEAIFVPNLNLDPVQAVFGEGVSAHDVYRAIELLMTTGDGHVPAGAMARLGGDPGLDAVAAAVRRQSTRSQEERLAAYAQAAASRAGIPVSPELVPALFRVCRHSMRAARFDPPPFVGNMTFLRCMEQQSFGITAGVGHMAAPFWENTCLGDFKVIDVPGNHFSVIEPPQVSSVVEHLASPLR